MNNQGEKTSLISFKRVLDFIEKKGSDLVSLKPTVRQQSDKDEDKKSFEEEKVQN